MRDHLSYSQLSTWLRCGLQFRFRYVDALDPEFMPASLAFGRAVHGAVEAFYRSRTGGTPLTDVESLMQAYTASWDDTDVRYNQGQDAQSHHDLAKGMLQAFLDSVRPREVVGVEQQMRVALPGDLPDLVGYVDCIERLPSGEICLTEIKTSARRYSESQAFDSLQLAAYAFLAHACGLGETVLVKYIVLTKTKTPGYQELVAVLDDADRSRFLRILEDFYQAVASGSFVANPSWMCGGCQYQSACGQYLGTRKAAECVREVDPQGYQVGETPKPYNKPEGPTIDGPEAVYDVTQHLASRRQEEIHVLLLNARHHLIRRSLVVRGGLNAASVEPREIFRAAVKVSAAAIVMVHNHPSGDPEPSEDDIRLTRRLKDAGQLLGIPLLDHLVVSKGGYVSLREHGRF